MTARLKRLKAKIEHLWNTLAHSRDRSGMIRKVLRWLFLGEAGTRCEVYESGRHKCTCGRRW